MSRKTISNFSDNHLSDAQHRSLRSRRRFLGQVGGLTTTTIATGLVSSSPLAGDDLTGVEAEQPFTNKRETRADQAMHLRHQAAEANRKLPLAPQPINGDEELIANRAGNFSKALPHNELGEVNPRAYESLLHALKTCRQDDFEYIPLGGSVKLANPQASMAFELEGGDPHYFSLFAPPVFSCAEQASEMVELYWQAVARDIHFSDYLQNLLIGQASVELSQLSNFRGPKVGGRVTPSALFRGITPGDLTGPYLSQFLFQDIPYGAMTIHQRYRVPQSANDHMSDYEEWIAIQNGAPAISHWLDDMPRYLRNGRDLAAYVHKDFSYQGSLNAALILLGWGQSAIDTHNPYIGSITQGAFCTFGGPFILDLVARVANAGLKASWYQKWQLHRRIRPEEFAGRVHNHLTKTTKYDLHPELLRASVLDIVFNKNESYLLTQAYPEGCPTHPSYPSEHAVIAGACVTVLKAFFNENFMIPTPVVSNSEGTMLEHLPGAVLRVGHELNKLASNLAMGRNFAGIHWRSDGAEGLKLGEAVALGILSDLKVTCHEQFRGFRLNRFDGATVIV